MVFGRHCIAITIHNSKGLVLSPQPELSEGVDLTRIAKLCAVPLPCSWAGSMQMLPVSSMDG